MKLRNKKSDDREGGKMETRWSSDVYEIVDEAINQQVLLQEYKTCNMGLRLYCCVDYFSCTLLTGF